MNRSEQKMTNDSGKFIAVQVQLAWLFHCCKYCAVKYLVSSASVNGFKLRFEFQL